MNRKVGGRICLELPKNIVFLKEIFNNDKISNEILERINVNATESMAFFVINDKIGNVWNCK